MEKESIIKTKARALKRSDESAVVRLAIQIQHLAEISLAPLAINIALALLHEHVLATNVLLILFYKTKQHWKLKDRHADTRKYGELVRLNARSHLTRVK